MGQFFCPICNNELKMDELVSIETLPSSIIQFHKQCEKCNSFLYFDSKIKAFRELPWWKRLFNINCRPTIELRKRTK